MGSRRWHICELLTNRKVPILSDWKISKKPPWTHETSGWMIRIFSEYSGNWSAWKGMVRIRNKHCKKQSICKQLLGAVAEWCRNVLKFIFIEIFSVWIDLAKLSVMSFEKFQSMTTQLQVYPDRCTALRLARLFIIKPLVRFEASLHSLDWRNCSTALLSPIDGPHTVAIYNWIKMYTSLL